MNALEMIRSHLRVGWRHHFYDVSTIHQILNSALVILKKQPTLLKLDAPVIICGDTHGQYSDVLRIFETCGSPLKNQYLFLGDYVDRGSYSVEVVVLLLLCKIQNPHRIHLLRGNHEIPSINRVYGFLSELRHRYPRVEDWAGLYEHFIELFSYLPLAAVINEKILCVHGGISPKLTSLRQINDIKRPIREPTGMVVDLLWSDPNIHVSGFAKNKRRQVSIIFGEDKLIEKLDLLGVDIMVRAHQIIDGYITFAQRRLISIFSASSCHTTYHNRSTVATVR
ncbi:hypothetical protein AB6A40_004998 [Gnathostoma spinigerum]|uniref:Serine/threonine-protein phosphatase n=1 Tax=Gnathostoma spinigerum TaxID=75299 RepID=A0ABD6ELU3_9BILA